MILGCLTLNDIKEINMGHEFYHKLGESVVIIIGKNLKYVMLVIPGHKYVESKSFLPNNKKTWGNLSTQK